MVITCDTRSATCDSPISTIKFSEKSTQGGTWTQVHQNIKIYDTNALTVTLSFAFLFLYIYMSYIVQVKNHENVMRAHHKFGYFRKCNINLGLWEKAEALIHFCALPFALKSFGGFQFTGWANKQTLNKPSPGLIIKSQNYSVFYCIIS